MKIGKLIVLGLLLWFNSGCTQGLFVSPNGNDSGSGTKSDPYATIERAIKEIASNKEEYPGEITINLREGVYSFTKNIAIDSTLNNITIKACDGEEVIFTGGVSIDVENIKPLNLAHKIQSPNSHGYMVNLKDLGIHDYGIIRNVGFGRPYGAAWGEFFVNNKPMHLSRWPNKGMIPMGKVLDKGSVPRHNDFANKGGEIKYDSLRINNWANEKDAWMSGYFMWGYADDMVKIASVDTVKHSLTTASATLYGYGDSKPWRNWYGVNLYSELDVPGEYYIDRDKGILSFISDEKSIKSLEFSTLEDPFFALEGCENIKIKGITFQCARGLGISMVNTHNVTVEDCVFRNLGSLAIVVGKGIKPFAKYIHEGTGEAQSGIVGSLQQHLYANTTFNREGGSDNRIVGCEFFQLGAGAISLGGGNRLTLASGNNVVENCLFHNINRIEKSYRPPVHITGVGNKVVHCEMFDIPSMAILMHGNNHLVEYNYIHDVCLDAEDQGAFYYGRDPSERGTIVRYNYFENIPDKFNTCAIYHDDGACGLTVTDNVFYKAGKWNVLLGGGSDNVYTNNIFIGNKFGFHVDNRLQTWSKWLVGDDGLYMKRLKAVNYQNKPYSYNYPTLSSYYDNAEIPSRNLVENNVFVKVKTLIDGNKEWLDFKDNNWITSEVPGFEDFEKKNFSLKKDAKLFKQIKEFRNIPIDKIGRY